MLTRIRLFNGCCGNVEGGCILRVWDHASALRPCLCPLCRRPISLLIPTESSREQRANPEVANIIGRIELYNRQYGERSSDFMQVFCSAIYVLSPVDIIPEGVLGIIGLVDDLILVLTCFLHVAALYRSVLVFRHGTHGG
uniref:DUF1232 domain-containing protein n=1 Tax=Chenopodium quinoa TaxID=63459 RepID=A0A803M522_CHEQI